MVDLHIETSLWYNLKLFHNRIWNFTAQMPSWDNEYFINVMNMLLSAQYIFPYNIDVLNYISYVLKALEFWIITFIKYSLCDQNWNTNGRSIASYFWRNLGYILKKTLLSNTFFDKKLRDFLLCQFESIGIPVDLWHWNCLCKNQIYRYFVIASLSIWLIDW